jgi:hypothetical protein
VYNLDFNTIIRDITLVAPAKNVSLFNKRIIIDYNDYTEELLIKSPIEEVVRQKKVKNLSVVPVNHYNASGTMYALIENDKIGLYHIP